MKVYLYSPAKSLVYYDEKESVITKNPCSLEFSGRSLIFYNGKNFENSLYHKDASLCENIAITDLYDAFLCYPVLKPRLNYPYKEIFKNSYAFDNMEYLISVYTDGGIKLSVKGFNEELTVPLPFIPKNLSVAPVGGNLFLIDVVKDLHFIVIVSMPYMKEEFSSLCNSYDVNGKLSVTKIRRTLFTFEETRFYNYDGKVNFINSSNRTFYQYNIPDELIPYAFLEEVRLSVDYRHFLSDGLVNDYTLIKDFLGEYDFVLPPFLKEFPTLYVTVGKTAKYVKTTVCNGKITDIALEDFPF